MTIPAMTWTVSSHRESSILGSSVVMGPLLAVLAAGSPLQAIAQEQSGFELGEVIVTARKREESLQQTPVAISAFTGQDLAVRQVSSTTALTDVTPNLTFDPVAPSSGMNTAAQIYIRGIGQSDFTMVTDPGVGLYIDGVYMARSVGGVLDFLDVERIEVLRGPQGTLFGRNTIGGAILISSRRPDGELHGNVQLDVGTDEKMYLTAHANIPVSETLKTSFSLSRRKRDGYVTRVTDGIDVGDEDSWGARMVALFEPTPTFSAHFTADYTKRDENGTPSVSGGINDLQTFAAIVNLIEPACPVTSLAPPARETNGNPNCANETADLGPYRSGSTFRTRSELEAWGLGLTLTWDALDWLTLKSITSYRDTEAASARDVDNTRFTMFETMDTWKHEQLTQELQFSGKAFNDRLKWLLGLYYFEEDGDNPNPVTVPLGTFRSGGSARNDSRAAFTQLTYDVTDRLALTLGARTTKDRKHFTPDQPILAGYDPRIPLAALPPPCRVPDVYCSSVGPVPIGSRLLPFQEFSREFDDTSFMGNLAFRWTDSIMTYFTYSEGFKSGGFDQRFVVARPAPSTFDPETVKSYELGFKSQWFEDTLRLNAAVFHTDYSDLQIVIRETFNPITYNGGRANIDGFELEAVWVPTSRWMITAALGHIDAGYASLDDTVVNNPTPVREDFRLVNTPKWSASVGVAYEFPLATLGTLTPRVDWSYHGAQYNDAINTPVLRQSSYHLLNAALTFRSGSGRWESSLMLRNITDETYLVTGAAALGTAASYSELTFGRPFEWGLAVRYNFF